MNALPLQFLMYQARELMAQRNVLRDEIRVVLENGSDS